MVPSPPVKLKLTMSKQKARLLQLATKKQSEKSMAEYREFSREGSPNLAAAALEDVNWLECVNILIYDLIYNSKV